MDHSIFDESIFEEEQEQGDELDFVRYAYGRHADIFDGHPLAAQDEFLVCLARHGTSEPNASLVQAESVDEVPAVMFD